MLTTALELLNIIESKGYRAYLVGGCVRDLCIGLDLCDIDVASTATMYDLSDVEEFTFMKSNRYGSSILIYKSIKFELTTFREEGVYIDGRRPSTYTHTLSLKTDAKRRDFTINSMYMDKSRNIIDIYDGKKDIKNKIIKTVGDANEKLYEDSLRILRAIRFATVLNFSLSDDVTQAIKKNKERVKLISYERRLRELDKIFVSDNRKYGIKLLIETGLDKELDLYNLENIAPVDDINGIWAQIKNEDYLLTKSSKKIVKQINYILDNNIDIMNSVNIYKYGLYVCMVSCKIKLEDVNKLLSIYSNMPITCFDDIDITTKDILDNIKIEDNRILKTIYDDIIEQILSFNIENKSEKIVEYLKNKYNVLK